MFFWFSDPEFWFSQCFFSFLIQNFGFPNVFWFYALGSLGMRASEAKLSQAYSVKSTNSLFIFQILQGFEEWIQQALELIKK